VAVGTPRGYTNYFIFSLHPSSLSDSFGGPVDNLQRTGNLSPIEFNHGPLNWQSWVHHFS